MPPKVHAVVQNAYDFDPFFVYDMEENEMTSPA
jgi:hypothetical protein